MKKDLGDTATKIAPIEAVQPSKAARAARVALGASEIARRAKAELAHITGLDADHVSAIAKDQDGWHVAVDLIELRRIPAATDVLAVYETLFGTSGSLISYHRTRRYFRDQMTAE